MKAEKRTDKVIVKKIIDYCDKVEILIERFGSTYEKFDLDFGFQMACGMCIMQIGELTTRLSEEFKNQHSEIAWNKIKGMRNIYAHDYENLDLEKIWATLTQDVPTLKENLNEIYLTLTED